MNIQKPVINFWVPYPKKMAPSQRFRVELFLPVLEKEGYKYEFFSFLDKKAGENFYERGRLSKTLGTMRGLFRRVSHLFKSIEADYILIHREAAPAGPPVFEWLLAKVFRKKIIYQYDDAIWIPGGEEMVTAKKWLKATWKVKYIIKWSYKVVGGNKFLCDYARKYNSSVFLIPTVVNSNTGHHILRDQNSGERIVVGWTGSHTTLHNLEEINTILPALKKEIDFDFMVISNKPPDLDFDFIYKKWEEETELEDLLKMHIGVMPLKKGPWFEGKCGFKLIQYMACGIPAIASPVGVNSQIALHNQTGFIANNQQEWKEFLTRLIRDPALRSVMGKKGRDHIEKNYSLNRYGLAFISLFS